MSTAQKSSTDRLPILAPMEAAMKANGDAGKTNASVVALNTHQTLENPNRDVLNSNGAVFNPNGDVSDFRDRQNPMMSSNNPENANTSLYEASGFLSSTGSSILESVAEDHPGKAQYRGAASEIVQGSHLIAVCKPNAPTRMRILYNEFKESDTESEDEFAEEAAQEIVVPIVHNNIITNGFGHSDTDSISSSDNNSADYENAIAFDNPPEENGEPVEAENNMGVQAYIIEFRHVNLDHIEHAENAAYMVNAYVQNGDDGNDGDEENDEAENNEAAENVAEINNQAAVNNEDEIGEFEDNTNRVNGLGV